MSATTLYNGHEVTIERVQAQAGLIAYLTIEGQQFSTGGNATDEQLAEVAYNVLRPEPSPERVEAIALAERRGEQVCERCGGHGGWRGWPGYYCHQCNGRRTVGR